MSFQNKTHLIAKSNYTWLVYLSTCFLVNLFSCQLVFLSTLFTNNLKFKNYESNVNQQPSSKDLD